MSAAPRSFREVWFQARREQRSIIAVVMMSNDSVCTVRFGPRGGWAVVRE